MSYWQKRQQKLMQAMEKDEAVLKKRLSSFFDAEYRKLDKEIAAYYKQYGTDNVIEYRRLMEQLSNEDRQLLYQRMEDFAKKYPQYTHLMPVRESIYKLNRLEGLQYSVRMQQLEIGAVNNEQITDYLDKQAMRGLNASAEVMGFGKNYYANNPNITRLFINVAWAGNECFSERIWGNTSKLAEYLNTDIAQGIARGDSYEKLTKMLRERFTKVSRRDAYRLVYTEGTFVMAESTMYPFTEDFEQYRISPVDDGKACGTCLGIAEQTFDIADRKAGVNFPPFHSWCRCTWEIVVEDWDKWMEEYERKYGSSRGREIAERLKNHAKNDIIKLSNVEVREWYLKEVSKIKDGIDPSLPIDEKSKLAFAKRNTIRSKAREMMMDEDTRKELERNYPNKTFEELVESKMKRKGLTREEAIRDIYDTSTKTNKNVNKELRLEDE